MEPDGSTLGTQQAGGDTSQHQAPHVTHVTLLKPHSPAPPPPPGQAPALLT